MGNQDLLYVPGVYVPADDAYLPAYTTAINIGKLYQNNDTKVIKIVRTVSGMRRYQQDKGSIIIRDGEAPLDAITAVANDIPGYEKVVDGSGNVFYVGSENGGWVIRNPKTNELMHTTYSEEDAFIWLNKLAGGGKGSLVDGPNPFRSSPNVKPTDSERRRNLRRDLSDPRYNLSVTEATAVDNMDDDGLAAYQHNRDRGLDHRAAMSEALADAARNRAKNKKKAK